MVLIHSSGSAQRSTVLFSLLCIIIKTLFIRKLRITDSRLIEVSQIFVATLKLTRRLSTDVAHLTSYHRERTPEE